MRRTAAFGFVSAILVAVAFGATSFACTSLATLNLSKPSGAAGEQLTVTGSSFGVSTATSPAAPVLLHWNAMDGPVVAQATPDATGSISATFAVPADAAPGAYVVIARQLDAEGKDHYGSPARAAFQVLGAGTQPLSAPAVASQPLATGTSGSSSAVGLALGLGVLGLVLFGAGFAAVVRAGRRQPVPARATARTED